MTRIDRLLSAVAAGLLVGLAAACGGSGGGGGGGGAESSKQATAVGRSQAPERTWISVSNTSPVPRFTVVTVRR